jgi:hypothetical protein
MAYYDLSTNKWSQIITLKMSVGYDYLSFDGLNTMIFSSTYVFAPSGLAGSYAPNAVSRSLLTMVLDEKAPSTVQYKFHPITPSPLFDGVGLYAERQSAYDPLRKRLYIAVSMSVRDVILTPDVDTREDTTIRPAIVFHTYLL